MFFSDVQHERVLASRILDNCTAKKKKKRVILETQTCNTELFLPLIKYGFLHLSVGDKSLQTPSKYQSSKHKLGLVRRDHHSRAEARIIGITIGTDNKYLHSL